MNILYELMSDANAKTARSNQCKSIDTISKRYYYCTLLIEAHSRAQLHGNQKWFKHEKNAIK